MKAILIKAYGDASQLHLGEVATPAFTDNQVLIRVKAAALNRADILQRKGLYAPPAGASDILGLEVSGEVVEAGKDARKWLGRKVMSLLSGGGYAEYVTVDQGLILDIPPSTSWEQAAGIMEAFLTAFQALHWLAKIDQGERLLIHAGASGVGTAAIQLAKSIGAEVWVTASSGKHDLCRKLGADQAIDYRKQDFAQVLNETVPQGLQVIMDFVGAPYFQQNLQCLALDGRLIMQGFLGGTQASSLDLSAILRKRLSIIGSTLRSRSLLYRQQLISDFQQHYGAEFSRGQLRPVIDRVFDWQRVAEAHRYMESNQNTGKIILSIA